MTSFCKTTIPKQIEDRLVNINEDEEKVKAYGIELGIEMCQKILQAGIPGIHFYTLNLDTSVKKIMEGLDFIPRSDDSAVESVKTSTGETIAS